MARERMRKAFEEVKTWAGAQEDLTRAEDTMTEKEKEFLKKYVARMIDYFEEDIDVYFSDEDDD